MVCMLWSFTGEILNVGFFGAAQMCFAKRARSLKIQRYIAAMLLQTFVCNDNAGNY
jgi:hypothetical protein